jgi:hypothetical protein
LIQCKAMRVLLSGTIRVMTGAHDSLLGQGSAVAL